MRQNAGGKSSCFLQKHMLGAGPDGLVILVHDEQIASPKGALENSCSMCRYRLAPIYNVVHVGDRADPRIAGALKA